MKNNNLTVGDLKGFLGMLSDDLPIVIPVISEDDPDVILGFRHIRTAGILEDVNSTECRPDIVLCINTASEGNDIGTQLQNYRSDIICKEVIR